MPMMAMTTSSSTRVKAPGRDEFLRIANPSRQGIGPALRDFTPAAAIFWMDGNAMRSGNRG